LNLSITSCETPQLFNKQDTSSIFFDINNILRRKIPHRENTPRTQYDRENRPQNAYSEHVETILNQMLGFTRGKYSGIAALS